MSDGQSIIYFFPVPKPRMVARQAPGNIEKVATDGCASYASSYERYCNREIDDEPAKKTQVIYLLPERRVLERLLTLSAALFFF